MQERKRQEDQTGAEAAVIRLSALGPHTYRVLGPLAGGQTGATAVQRSDDGIRFVLKWEFDEANQRSRRVGVDLAERLRSEAGWPSPKQELVEAGDCLFVLQELMPGRVVEHLTERITDRLLALHEVRLDMAPPPIPSTWGEDLVQLLVEGGNGWCLHEPLRRFDRRTRHMIGLIEEIGRSTRPVDLDGSQIVHGDLHTGNLLQLDGALSAVVDMDYTRLGDAAFDLTTLAVSSVEVAADPGVRERLFSEGIASLPATKRRAYVANLLLRNLDWAARGSRAAEVDFWLAEAPRLLGDE